MARLKDYWQIVVIALAVVSFGGWLTHQQFQIEAAEKTANDAQEIAKQQADISAKLSAIVIQNDTKLGVYLEIMGFDDSVAREWGELPRSASHDSLGNAIPWVSWLETDSVLQVGVRYMFNDSGRVLVDTLWDFREKAKK